MGFQIKTKCVDFLILGGGTAGCWAAMAFRKACGGSVLIAEKANIRRSGCLAAGVNALNAYIVPGKTPQDYVAYARKDAEGIVRGDLLLSMAKGLNSAAQELEKLGLTILKDENGQYAVRGTRNIKINGENIKPLLADAVAADAGITILNRVNVFSYLKAGENRIAGALAFGIDEPVLYVLRAKAVLCATGGAAGLYKPNHSGFSQHKMWYPPFNTGAGLAMGMLAGAEMTTLEMRFIALRCRDTIAPTGTLAQGVGARQINAAGEVYESKYGLTTSQRLYGTVMETAQGRGPCFLRTTGISAQQEEELFKAYLNMAPSQTLRWLESGKTPCVADVPIAGTEPYIVGGHTASGYWVNTHRETTLRGLFAAGDVAGGCPQKYVTGVLVEGEIAAKAAASYCNEPFPDVSAQEIQDWKNKLEVILNHSNPADASTDELEAQMQTVMDEYAGGISTDYACSAQSLAAADKKIAELQTQAGDLHAADLQELVYVWELRERLTLCRAVIAHLAARKETRWHCFAERTDFPDRSADWNVYVNSRMENGEFRVFTRPLVGEEICYEH